MRYQRPTAGGVAAAQMAVVGQDVTYRITGFTKAAQGGRAAGSTLGAGCQGRDALAVALENSGMPSRVQRSYWACWSGLWR